MIIIEFDDTYNERHYSGELHIQTATVMMGISRMRMQAEAREPDETDPDKLFALAVYYPNMIVSTPDGRVEIDGRALEWPLTFDDFIALPEPIFIAWDKAVEELNPQWYPGAKKKAAQA